MFGYAVIGPPGSRKSRIQVPEYVIGAHVAAQLCYMLYMYVFTAVHVEINSFSSHLVYTCNHSHLADKFLLGSSLWRCWQIVPYPCRFMPLLMPAMLYLVCTNHRISLETWTNPAPGSTPARYVFARNFKSLLISVPYLLWSYRVPNQATIATPAAAVSNRKFSSNQWYIVSISLVGFQKQTILELLFIEPVWPEGRFRQNISRQILSWGWSFLDTAMQFLDPGSQLQIPRPIPGIREPVAWVTSVAEILTGLK